MITKQEPMTPQEIAILEKEVNKAKFRLSQKAGALHDLIEDQLLDAFENIPSFAEETYKAACEWNQLKQNLDAAKKA